MLIPVPATVKLVLFPAQIVISVGCPVILSVAGTVSVAALEVIGDTGQTPVTTQRYWLLFNPTVIPVIVKLADVAPE